ncbi:MAG: hypothetical protein LBK18_08895 [Prevotellaceae bacterium]|jgi:hypothetical protein|nr:hypothetical protein [Prevotellaceae bacterium]
MEILQDQNTVRLGGLTVKFYPVNRVKRTHCLPCFLMRYPGVDCTKIPCRSFEREDKKDGVFSIRELPKPEQDALRPDDTHKQENYETITTLS